MLPDCIRVDAPSSENPANGLANLIIWRARSSSHSNPQRIRCRQPVGDLYALFGAERTVADGPVDWIDGFGVLDVKRRDSLGTEGCERHGVARVIPSDHHHYIQ